MTVIKPHILSPFYNSMLKDGVRKMENPVDTVALQFRKRAMCFLNYLEQPYTCKISAHKCIDDTGKEYSAGDDTIQKEIPLQARVFLGLAIYTGARKGEVLPLTWSDIDFSDDRISISKAVTLVEGKAIINAPKTKTSFRKISIPPHPDSKTKKMTGISGGVPS